MISHALTVAAVLSRVRAATLSRPISSIVSIHTKGTIQTIGLRGSINEWDDARHGSFVQRVGGPAAISGTDGWNSHVAWHAEPSGLVRIDGGRSTRLQDIDQAYLDTYAYLRPSAAGARTAFLGERSEGGVAYDVVQVTPPGGSALQLWVDRKTSLIERVTGTIGMISSTTTLSDYRLVHGIAIPFQQATQSSSGNNSTEAVASVTINEPLATSFASPPRSDAHDYFISGGSSTTVPISLINNHIYLRVKLDGKGPYTFIFDTGGTYVVTPAVAAALGASAGGHAQIHGVGAGSETVQFAHVKRLQIGKATIANPDFLVLPIGQSFGVAEGFPIDGMIGYDVPARFLTTIDYAARTMTLAIPGGMTPQGSAVPFFFDGTIPRVPITIDGVRTDAELDTGNRGAFDLFSPFLASHPKIAAAATTSDAVNGFGVGGPAMGRLGRVDVGIGTFALDGVVAGFSTQHTGALADPFTPANIGGDLWRRFTLTLDYPDYRIFLKPNASYGTPFTYDRSGLFLINYHGGVMVLDARPGTPAAAAGLKKGDFILAVNGKAASAYTLAQLRALLSGAPGTAIRLHVRSGSADRDLTLTLRDYV